MDKMTPEVEAKKILEVTNGDLSSSLEILDRQLNTLYLRAQVLMSLCGVVITVTGFSGRIIAGTSRLAQVSIIAGLSTVLLSAVYMFVKVMTIKWITTEISDDPIKTLTKIIERRNRKTSAYVNGGIILCCGFMLYCIAVALMLLSPN
ncbi:MAG: hypothetical protein ACYTFY_04060 [Planctomycetota bacterium]